MKNFKISPALYTHNSVKNYVLNCSKFPDSSSSIPPGKNKAKNQAKRNKHKELLNEAKSLLSPSSSGFPLSSNSIISQNFQKNLVETNSNRNRSNNNVENSVPLSSSNRKMASSSSFFFDSSMLAIDSDTGRKHIPITSDVIGVSVCGAPFSLANQAFRRNMYELMSSPTWMSSGVDFNRTFSIDFLEVYFETVARTVALRTIVLNITSLYTEWIEERKFADDEILDSLLASYFYLFIPKRKELVALRESLDYELSKFYLPPEIVKFIEDTYKVTCIPTTGYETFEFNSMNLPLPSSVLNFKPEDGDSMFCDTIVNFPWDTKIVSRGKTYNNMRSILRYHYNLLSYTSQPGGEFADFHTLMRSLTPDWNVSLEDASQYVYTKQLSNGRKISQMNVPTPVQCPARINSVLYDHTRNGKNTGVTNSLFYTIEYLGFNVPALLHSVECLINDNEAGGVKLSINREYRSDYIWHDRSSFDLSVNDLLFFQIPYAANFPKPQIKGERNRPVNICEPGLIHYQCDTKGNNFLYVFYDDMRNDADSVCNKVTSRLSIDQIKDYYSALGRVSGHMYVEATSEKPSNLEVVPFFLSAPGLRRGSLNLDVAVPELFEKLESFWRNSNLLTMYKRRHDLDLRPQYGVYDVNLVTKTVVDPK